MIGSGSTGRENPDGDLTHSLVFRCDTFEEVLTCGPATWEGIPRKKGGRSWAKGRERAGKYVVTVVYEGLPSGQAELERWKMVPTKSDEPMEAHPWIEMLAEKFNGEEQDDGSIRFTRYLPNDGESSGGSDPLNFNRAGDGRVKNPMFGLETYIKKAMIVRLTFRYRNLPQNYLEMDGTVIDRIPNPRYDLWPDRDWLVWVGEIDEEGEGDEIFYSGTVDFVLGPPGGWPPMYWLIDRLQ